MSDERCLFEQLVCFDVFRGHWDAKFCVRSVNFSMSLFLHTCSEIHVKQKYYGLQSYSYIEALVSKVRMKIGQKGFEICCSFGLERHSKGPETVKVDDPR